jgi:protein gp37
VPPVPAAVDAVLDSGVEVKENQPGNGVSSTNLPVIQSPSDSDVSEKESDKEFTVTNEKVDWAYWTWNPVTGCELGCPYCYAERIAKRIYKEKFAPTFRPERLVCPRNTKLTRRQLVETDPIKRVANRNVFVCSMADLFGHWVPDEWIDRVFQACRDNPQWNYLFLTKNPHRYVNLDIDPAFWMGTTVDIQSRVTTAERTFSKITCAVKWLSVEPMLEPLKFHDLSVFDWVVIGGQSAQTGMCKEFYPEPRWVNRLIHDAHEAGCKVFCKHNADPTESWVKLFKEYVSVFTDSELLPSNSV